MSRTLVPWLISCNAQSLPRITFLAFPTVFEKQEGFSTDWMAKEFVIGVRAEVRAFLYCL